MPTASAIAAAVAAATRSQASETSVAKVVADDVVFTIEVNFTSDLITIPFAPSSMTINDLIQDLVVAE
jgi:hypothetical protein